MSIQYPNIANESSNQSALLDFYAKHGAALFPMHRGSKAPHGIVASWRHDFSRDRKQWRQWALDNPGCNFGVVAFASLWIICDIDTSGEAGEAEAWALWTELCKSWGLPEPLPAHVRSQSGGFHVYFAVPAGVDASTLRQPDAIKGRVNIRCVGYVVAAGSVFEGRPYTLLNDIPPHPAPAALIKHCSREPRKMEGASLPGSHDFSDVAALVTWMTEREMFAAYEDWVAAGMALKASFGEEGFTLWDITHEPDVSPSQAASKWESFASEPDANGVTLASLMKRAHSAGWTGSVRKSTAQMFEGVAEMVASPPLAPDLPPLPSYPESKESEPRRSLRDRRVNAASLAGKPAPEREWLVPGWIPMEQVTLLYGDGAVGKSLLAMQLCAATGTHWFGMPVKRGPVEFVTAEDSAGELHRRLADISRETRQPLENIGHLHVSSFADEDAIMAALNGEGQLVKTTFYDEVVEVVQETKPVLLVLDTLADIYGGNEVVRAHARAFVNMLRKIAIAHNLAVVVLAHPSLSGMSTGKGTSGSTGWNNSVRSRLYLDRVHDDEGMEPDTDARVLRSMKMNYGKVGNEIHMHWKNGVFVVDGVEAGSDPMSQRWKADRVFLELLDRANEHNVDVSGSPQAKNYAPKVFVGDALKKGIKKRDLTEAMARLLDAKKIENAPIGPLSRRTRRLQRIYVPPVTMPPL